MGTCEVADDTDGDHRWCAGTLSPSGPLFTGPDAMLRINSRAGGLAGHAPTPVAPSRRGPRGGTLLACEERPVIVVLDEQAARRQLDAGRLACPGVRRAAGPVGPRQGPAGPPAWWAAILAAATTGRLRRLRRHPRAAARRLPAPPRGPQPGSDPAPRLGAG